MMNIGIVTSYIIGGILLISVLSMNLNINSSATGLTMQTVKHIHLENLLEIIYNDIPKMGYNRTQSIDTSTIIQQADSTNIRFYGNIDNSADETVETIRWKLGPSDNSTPNPNDRVLTRLILYKGTVNSKVDIKLGVTRFHINYYSQPGSATPMPAPLNPADLDKIRQVEIILELQTAKRVKSNPISQGEYLTSYWSKRFTPANL